MKNLNRFHQIVPEALVNDAIAKLTAIRDSFTPYLLTVTDEDRRSYMRLGSKQVEFVEKTLHYTKTNPELAPPFFDHAGFEIDCQGRQVLLPLFNLVSQLYSQIDDTMLVCGSESYEASRNYYRMSKHNSDNGIAAAKTVAEDLSNFFTRAKPSARKENV